ncbi:MAG: mevalonate kinase [Saprospiraceae bacterium]|nr:mevalonate kinase [Saprospiraceae bacterium]MCB9324150.1 mevalonate kinase [Lewinellaceae bacterium]
MPEYNSKLLLFGEYLIIRSGRALAVPYQAFGGGWDFDPENLALQQNLPALANHLSNLSKKGNLLCELNLEAFFRDLDKGLFFDSNIPVGYGLGSSGALSAALYDKYGTDKIDKNAVEQFGTLRKILSQIENFFHGSSSGIDPLISYINQPVVIGEDGSVELISLPETKESQPFFLLDTQMPRQTGPLVQLFLKKCEYEAYSQQIDGSLTSASISAIDHFIQNNQISLAADFTRISALQYDLFFEMIPESFRRIWQAGLDSGAFSLKLCGAGGGGFMLGYAADLKRTVEMLNFFNWKWVEI